MLVGQRSTSKISLSQLRLIVGLTLAFCVGCKETATNRLKVLPVSGSVSVKGKPASGAMVTLHPIDKSIESLNPRGQASADGVFQLSTYVQGDGAPVGEYMVTVVWPDEEFKPVTAEQKEALVEGRRPDRLRGRFASPNTSKLKVKIEEGQSELPAVELE